MKSKEEWMRLAGVCPGQTVFIVGERYFRSLAQARAVANRTGLPVIRFGFDENLDPIVDVVIE
jgi:hypothetical protein